MANRYRSARRGASPEYYRQLRDQSREDYAVQSQALAAESMSRGDALRARFDGMTQSVGMMLQGVLVGMESYQRYDIERNRLIESRERYAQQFELERTRAEIETKKFELEKIGLEAHNKRLAFEVDQRQLQADADPLARKIIRDLGPEAMALLRENDPTTALDKYNSIKARQNELVEQLGGGKQGLLSAIYSNPALVEADTRLYNALVSKTQNATLTDGLSGRTLDLATIKAALTDPNTAKSTVLSAISAVQTDPTAARYSGLQGLAAAKAREIQNGNDFGAREDLEIQKLFVEDPDSYREYKAALGRGVPKASALDIVRARRTSDDQVRAARYGAAAPGVSGSEVAAGMFVDPKQRSQQAADNAWGVSNVNVGAVSKETTSGIADAVSRTVPPFALVAQLTKLLPERWMRGGATKEQLSGEVLSNVRNTMESQVASTISADPREFNNQYQKLRQYLGEVPDSDGKKVAAGAATVRDWFDKSKLNRLPGDNDKKAFVSQFEASTASFLPNGYSIGLTPLTKLGATGDLIAKYSPVPGTQDPSFSVLEYVLKRRAETNGRMTVQEALNAGVRAGVLMFTPTASQLNPDVFGRIGAASPQQQQAAAVGIPAPVTSPTP